MGSRRYCVWRTGCGLHLSSASRHRESVSVSIGAAFPLSCDQNAVYERLTLSGTKYLGDRGSLPEPLKRNGRYTASDTVCDAGSRKVQSRVHAAIAVRWDLLQREATPSSWNNDRCQWGSVQHLRITSSVTPSMPLVLVRLQRVLRNP